MRSDLNRKKVTWLPALPEEGWASMDRYWSEMDRCAEAGDSMKFHYTKEIEQWLGEPPAHSATDMGWRRALKKYLWYPGIVKNFEADLIHVLDQSYAHLIPSIQPHIKVVASVFDVIPLEVGYGMNDGQRARFKKCVMNLTKADHIISISEETKKKLENLLGIPPEKVSVALPGMDLKGFQTELPASQSIKNRLSKLPPILFSVGSTLKRKNLESLLDIFSEMKESFKEKKCCFVRAGQYFDEPVRKKFLSLLGEDGFVELGPLFGEDLIAAYQSAKIFLFPSTLEGLTFTIPEAMAAKCAVVTNKCTANPEAGGDAALYYEEGNAKEASLLIRRLLNDCEWYEKHVKLGSTRAEFYTWERHFSVVESVYEKVLGI